MRTRTPRRRLALATLFTAVAATACDGGVLEDRWPSYRVVGRVTGPSGTAVAGATVSLRSLTGPSCVELLSVGGPFTAAAGGRYAGGFGSAAGTFRGCVEASAVPPAGARLLAITRRVENVQLSHAAGDSVVVDIQLPAAP